MVDISRLLGWRHGQLSTHSSAVHTSRIYKFDMELGKMLQSGPIDCKEYWWISNFGKSSYLLNTTIVVLSCCTLIPLSGSLII